MNRSKGLQSSPDFHILAVQQNLLQCWKCSVSALLNAGATSHVQPLSTRNAAPPSGELNFTLDIILVNLNASSHRWLVAAMLKGTAL